MQFDLGIQGLGILLSCSLVFGALALVVFGRRSTRWVGLLAAVGAFIGGLYMSEVVFATRTVDEIQPIIDGLAFDEALLGSLIGGLLVGVATRLAVRPVAPHGRIVP